MKKQNWEISFDMHLARYRQIDPAEAAARTGFDFDPGLSRFILSTLGHRLYAEWPEFKLIPADGEHCPKVLYDVQMQVLAMRVLYLGIYTPPSGSFKAYREMPWGELYDTNFNGRCIKRFAYAFGFKPDSFAKAAGLLGGKRLVKEDASGESSSAGDVAYDFSFLGGITCRFILWKPDEEFPPSAQILFSDNSVLMYNAEDLAAVGDVIISSLKSSG